MRVPVLHLWPNFSRNHPSMWKVEPNVNLFSQQRTTTTTDYRGQSDPVVSFLLRQLTQNLGKRVCFWLPWVKTRFEIRQALRPLAFKIACAPSKLTPGGPAGPADFETIVIPFWVPSPVVNPVIIVRHWLLHSWSSKIIFPRAVDYLMCLRNDTWPGVEISIDFQGSFEPLMSNLWGPS